MRLVEIKGYVIYDDNEMPTGLDVVYRLENLLFNENFPREWEFTVISDKEIEWEDEE